MFYRLRARVLALALFAGLFVAVPGRAGAQSSGERIHQHALKFVVWIMCCKDGKPVSTGSGSLIDAQQRLILTNHHVVEGGDQWIVMFPQIDKNGLIIDQERYKARVVRVLQRINELKGAKDAPPPKVGKGRRAPNAPPPTAIDFGVIPGRVLFSETRRDLAVIKLDWLPNEVNPVKLAESSPGPGATVHSVGSPGTSESLFVYTPGKVRQVSHRRYLTGGPGDDPPFEVNCTILQTTSPTNPGDSGGPMMNGRGELVAVTQGGHRVAQALNSFVDVSEVRAMLKERKITLGDQNRAAVLAEVPPPDNAERVFERSLRSTAFIVFRSNDGLKSHDFGSGTLIDAKNRLIVADYQAAERGECQVLFPAYDDKGKLIVERDRYVRMLRENAGIPAKLLARDPKLGLALLQLERLPKDAVPLKLAGRSPGTGARVHSVGNPGFSEALWCYTPGLVRQVYQRRLKVGDVFEYELDCDIIETNSPINSGDSGGPMLDERGELVGIAQTLKEGGQLVSIFVDVSALNQFLKAKNIALADQAAAPGLPEARPVGKGGGPVVAADPREGVAKKEPEPAKKEEPKTSAADENKAAAQMVVAQSLADQGKKELAMRRLQDLLKNYPNTKVAREARDLLKQLQK
jgi:S1-C subfamily serine protease